MYTSFLKGVESGAYSVPFLADWWHATAGYTSLYGPQEAAAPLFIHVNDYSLRLWAVTQSRNGECCSLPQLGGPFPQSSVSYFSAARQHGLNGWQGFYEQDLVLPLTYWGNNKRVEQRAEVFNCLYYNSWNYKGCFDHFIVLWQYKLLCSDSVLRSNLKVKSPQNLWQRWQLVPVLPKMGMHSIPEVLLLPGILCRCRTCSHWIPAQELTMDLVLCKKQEYC